MTGRRLHPAVHGRTCVGANDVELVADAHGDPDAPAVLLLHGGGQTRHSWGGVRLPVLLVRGGRSDVLSRELAAEFLALVPHAEFADVGDAHHMVAGDQNDAFAVEVVEFLSRVTKTTR